MTPHHVNTGKRGKVAKESQPRSMYCVVFHGPQMYAAWLSSLVWEAVRGGAALGADRQPPAIGRRNARDTLTSGWIFRSVPQA
jgi:hypothetical protein